MWTFCIQFKCPSGKKGSQHLELLQHKTDTFLPVGSLSGTGSHVFPYFVTSLAATSLLLFWTERCLGEGLGQTAQEVDQLLFWLGGLAIGPTPLLVLTKGKSPRTLKLPKSQAQKAGLVPPRLALSQKISRETTQIKRATERESTVKWLYPWPGRRHLLHPDKQ